MGWFDESDEEDNSANIRSNEPIGNGGGIGAGTNGEDYEEDPLDAYMNSLEAPAPSSSSGAAANLAGGRLDHDAEEEATSHWRIDRKAADTNPGARLLPKVAGFGDDDDDDDDVPQPSVAAREARSAMSFTFVPAGGRSKKDDVNVNERDEGCDDSENEYADLQKQLHKKHIQMQHEEIDPLEKINHKQIKYAPFRRQFYIPPDTETGHAWRREHEVTCTPPKFDPILGFGELDFTTSYTQEKNNMTLCPPELLKTIAKQGYDTPTPVQSQTLPVALSGNDAIITASTGSGKTLSYIWPLVIHISDQPYIQPGVDGPIGVVLTPTRELAKQVYKYAKIFIECIGGKVVEVAGGNKGTWELIKELKKGCEMLVGTPGRVIDVVRKKGTNLGRITFVVLDEADRMLDMGFEKQVSSILENIRPDRQTLLLSATFAKRVEKVARSWLRDPVRIAIGRAGASSEHVDQHVMVLPSRDSKIQWLVEMLPVLSPLGRCLVFVATRADCDILSQMVQSSPSFSGGSSSTVIVSIHGDKNQADRNSAIAQFKKNTQAILIATDVAARGLDIPNIMTVINFDAAKNIDSHVHRVGRAGRLQKDGDIDGGHQRGTSYTLLTDKDADFAQLLVEAFEREGRTTSQELFGLAHKSKRFGGGRVKHSRTGLGFGGNVNNPASTSDAIRQSLQDTREIGRVSNVGAYYGSSDPPITKRSRWG